MSGGSVAGSGLIGLAKLNIVDEEVRRQVAKHHNVGLRLVEMFLHAANRPRRVTHRHGLDNGRVLADDQVHAALLRLRQPAVAIDLHLDLPNQIPDAGAAGDGCDSGVKFLFGLLEDSFMTSMFKANGDPLAFFERPIAAVLGLVTLAIWIAPACLRGKRFFQLSTR